MTNELTKQIELLLLKVENDALKEGIFKLEHRLKLATNMYLAHKDMSMVELKREIVQKNAGIATLMEALEKVMKKTEHRHTYQRWQYYDEKLFDIYHIASEALEVKG